MKSLFALLLACGGAWACRSESTGPSPQQQAFVGFPSAVDTALLRSAGATLLEARATPPAARVEASDAALRLLEASPLVSYVVVLNYLEPGDSAGIFLVFGDRPTVSDTLSDADRQVVVSVGGRITYVSTSVPAIAAMVPVWAIPTLETSVRVTSLEVEGPPGFPV